MRSFYFIRHGETDWNKIRRLQGRSDIELNQTGIDQAEKASETLKNQNFDHIISSPLKRAHKTAEIISRKHHGINITTHPQLVEQCFGEYEGKLLEELCLKHGVQNSRELQPYYPNNAESLSELKLRATQALKSIFHNYEGNILIVSHGLFGSIMSENLGLKNIRFNNASPYFFRKENNKYTLEELT